MARLDDGACFTIAGSAIDRCNATTATTDGNIVVVFHFHILMMLFCPLYHKLGTKKRKPLNKKRLWV